MTDLEICKRIAEIEKLNQVEIKGNVLVSKGFSCDRLYNPLTDDALCFKLMVKYKVRAHCLWEENDGTPHYEAYINEDSSDLNYDKSPNKAICLAIIEVSKQVKGK